MNGMKIDPRATSVKPSGRPYGLDAGEWFPHADETDKAGTETAFLQTPNHNLISEKNGPTIGDHFNL